MVEAERTGNQKPTLFTLGDMMKRIFAILTFLFLFAGNVYAATDQILATEEMVGSGHATKSDTLNRALNKLTTAGDIPYATAAQTVSRLGIGTAGQFLQTNAGATAPEWAGGAGDYVGTDGYQKLPGGLIIQWGRATGLSGTITFSLAFPNKVLAMTGNSTDGSARVNSITFNGIGTGTNTIDFYQSINIGFSWIAVGY